MSRSCRNIGLACALALLVALPAGADTLLIDSVRQADKDGREVPSQGATKEVVQDAFGEPQSRRGPVGEPPITRWDYEGISVYFEHDRVVWTVRDR